MDAINTKLLTRVYAKSSKLGLPRGIHGLNLGVKRGETKGLLGPNGAGKTTLTKVLATILSPTSGTACVLGHDLKTESAKIRTKIGLVLGGDRGLYPHLSGKENLLFWAALYGLYGRKRKHTVDTLLDKFGLMDVGDSKCNTYSRGMKQRLHLARGLIGQPELLFLDEPTLGMDPVAAREFRTIVHELKRSGITILLTTHDMAEAESVCDEVVFINQGVLLTVESPASLVNTLFVANRIDFVGPPITAAHLRSMADVTTLDEIQVGHYRAHLSNSAAVKTILLFLVSQGVTVLNTSKPNLEEVYLHLLGPRGMSI